MNILKNKAVLYSAIGLNLGLFGLGFYALDIPLMTLSLLSMLCCYIGTRS